MELQFLGASKGVTGSCYSLSNGNEKIFVDCGMFQGSKESHKLNYQSFDLNPREYSALLLTHAHLDHCGRIPSLVKQGFKGKIYATEATKALAFIVMADSAKIAMEDTRNENKRRALENLPARNPVFSMADVNQAMRLFKTVKYGDSVKITDNISAKFYDAGHILGSASIQVKVNEKGKERTISFSGDLGQEDSILVRHTEPIKESDFVLMESTYGDRLHNPTDQRKGELIRIIKETYNRGGKLLIPSFAIERTQELLFYLDELMTEGIIPKQPVFLDSPMAIRATEVFKKFTGYFNEHVQERLKVDSDVFGFPGLSMTTGRRDSMEINRVNEPCIIIAGSGMCTAGRIKHHIANNVEDEKNTLLFVGFQVEGTLGNHIQSGEKRIRLLGREVEMNAHVETIDGFSAHGDRDDLYKWLSGFEKKPKVFIIHGDFTQKTALAKNLKAKGYDCYIPEYEETITI